LSQRTEGIEKHRGDQQSGDIEQRRRRGSQDGKSHGERQDDQKTANPTTRIEGLIFSRGKRIPFLRSGR